MGLAGVRYFFTAAVDNRTKETAAFLRKLPFLLVPVTGLDLHFLPWGENIGSHQCLHWWQELSTGQFHCYGFESDPYKE